MAISKWLEVEEKLTLIEAWARNGLIEKDICHNLGIGTTTLKDYKNRYPSLASALKKGKEVADVLVENALYKRATGYTVTLNKQKVTKDGDVLDITEEVYVAPDTTAQIFWLKNRKPLEWRDKREIDKTIEVRVPLLEDMQSLFKTMRQANKVELIEEDGSLVEQDE